MIISPDINSNIFSAKSGVEVKDQLVALSKNKNYSFRQNASDQRANIIYVFNSNNPNKSFKLKFDLVGTKARDQMKKFNEFIAGIE